MSTYEAILDAAGWIRARDARTPAVAIVLGSGLGALTARVTTARELAYGEIPHWPIPKAAGHAGRLVLGEWQGRQVALLAGRVHVYEGYDLSAVTFAVRVMGTLGARVLILTNAAGGIGPSLEAGDLMIIEDHLNLMGSNPLIGANDDRLGPRFPDMTEAYAPRLRALALEAADAAGLSVAHGVYAAVHGPSYETPAEIRWLRTIGADAVGMSTVPETIAARHMGLEVLGISCIANKAAGIHEGPLDHQEVLETARRTEQRLGQLLEGIVGRL